MRIISGKNKGKRLLAPKNLPVRPTTDMAKEGLFNILGNRYTFSEITVLDLFAGTGNVSYEFSSRNTVLITAVDANYHCVQYIKNTSNELKANIKTVKSDVFRYLKKTSILADVIFADPPYNLFLDDFKQIPQLIFERKLLQLNGLLIIEHSSNTELDELPFFVEKRKYGGSVFSFFQNQ